MTDTTLPPPLVPAEVDLRGTPIPRDMLIELAIASFGMSAAEAADFVNKVGAEHGIAMTEARSA